MIAASYSKPPKTISGQSSTGLRADYSGPMPTAKPVTMKEMEFNSRMDDDIDGRRKTKFVNEISALRPTAARARGDPPPRHARVKPPASDAHVPSPVHHRKTPRL